MQKTNELVLLKGLFSPDEASEILTALFDYKINYHHLEIFGMKERMQAANVSRHETRLLELKSECKKLALIIAEAKEKNLHLSVKGNITIELINA